MATLDRLLPAREHLETLYARIDERVRAVLDAQPGWPCRRGCDGCCRRLAAPPSVTRLEWELMREGIAALSPEVRAAVAESVKLTARFETSRPPPRHHVCPLLDQAARACLVYSQRPVACRTYGFYLSRGEGLWCAQIVELVSGRDTAEVVWGSQEGIEAAVTGLSGPSRELGHWFAEQAPE